MKSTEFGTCSLHVELLKLSVLYPERLCDRLIATIFSDYSDFKIGYVKHSAIIIWRDEYHLRFNSVIQNCAIWHRNSHTQKIRAMALDKLGWCHCDLPNVPKNVWISSLFSLVEESTQLYCINVRNVTKNKSVYKSELEAKLEIRNPCSSLLLLLQGFACSCLCANLIILQFSLTPNKGVAVMFENV